MNGNSLSYGSAGFSAAVRLTLHAGGHAIPLSQVGPTWLCLDHPTTLASGKATLRIEVDGHCDLADIEIEAQPEPAQRFNYLLA